MAKTVSIWALAALFACAPALAQRNLKADVAQSRAAEGRVALIIGNSSYKEAPLANPVNDATDMAKALQGAGFKVILRRNAGTRDMRQAIREFGNELRKAEVGLFYFAGHGMQVRGNNYLIPVGADIQGEADVEDLAIDASYALRVMEEAQVKVNIVILDACRNNPFARSMRSASRGLAQMTAATGSLVAFATAPGSVAADGTGRNGVYTKHLLASLGQPDTDILRVFQRTRAGVVKETGGKQVPWESTSLVGDFFFKPPSAAPAPQVASVAPTPVAVPAAPSGPVKRIPIAIAAFGGERDLAPGLLSIVRSNLERSGMFSPLDSARSITGLTEATAIDYAEWQARSAEALVAGSVAPRADGRMDVRFRVYDVAKRAPVGGVAYAVAANQVRATGHRMSDFIHEKLSGERGVFSTRIAYVAEQSGRFDLVMAESDGAGAETALRSHRPIASVAFSADGRELAYVSYEQSTPDRALAVAYIHDLAAGRRRLVLNMLSAPARAMTLAWIPNQKTLIVLANTDQGTTFYAVETEGSSTKVLATSPSRDSRPAITPEGAWIYFTSERSGSRQIHRMPASGGEAERLTTGRSVSFAPALSPDGNSLAYVTQESGQTRLAVMDLASRRIARIDEAPAGDKLSFSPNGKLVLLVSERDGAGVLKAVSVDGSDTARWTVRPAQDLARLSEPAWGPFLQ